MNEPPQNVANEGPVGYETALFFQQRDEVDEFVANQSEKRLHL